MYAIYLLLKFLKKFDPFLVIVILILQSIGLLALYSATHEAYSENISLFTQQIIWIILSWIAFFIISYTNHSVIIKYIWSAYWFHIVILILTLVIGKEIFGTKRWIDLGFFNYQPSETLKIVLMVLVAKQLSLRKFQSPFNLQDLILFIGIISMPISLVLIQPDLGTSGMILLIVSIMILFNGIKKRLFMILMTLSLISLPMAWNFVLKPYQKERIVSFVDPEKNPRGSGYNVIQSKIAIGSGKIFGKGFKKGTQNRLQFLPERHTDFIFSVISEEYGLVGSTFTLALFFALIAYIFRLASLSRDRFSCYLCIGSGLFFLWHVTLNTAMTMGLFPVVGAPLPLLSYGGSHMITSMCFLGLVAHVYKKKRLFYS